MSEVVRDWDMHKAEFVDFNTGNGCGTVRLPEICRLIINTLIFDRLKYIMQLGLTHYVFPGATHTRFVHSISTAYYAFELAKVIQLHHPDLITGSETLCITLAALCHDLGHVPYSHLFEDVLPLQNGDKKFKHEEMSVKLFEKILAEYPDTRKGLKKYLSDEHIKFICDLINPPKNLPKDDEEWNLYGNRDKAFLFGIVSNPLNGLDVDKFEYMLRDADCSGVNIAFDKEIILRVISSARIHHHVNYGFNWIAFSEKHLCNVRQIFETRKRLYNIVCYHRMKEIIDDTVKEALKLAGSHMYFENNAGKIFSMMKCPSDPDAYLQLNDNIFNTILHSKEKVFEPARNLLKTVVTRRVPKIIAKFDSLKAEQGPAEIASHLRKTLSEITLKSCYKSSSSESYFKVITETYHAGKGNVNPIPKVLFYPRNKDLDAFVYSADHGLESMSTIFIYVPYECSDDDAKYAFGKLKNFAEKRTIVPPINMFKPSIKV
uniref:Phosphohydrolase n=1 Tax=Panagrolaimus sp. PS1159 TaxID=55785 RepID=A0AC35G4T3_9BILA